jgi:hypothetical protein
MISQGHHPLIRSRRIRPTIWQQLQALLILLSIGAIIVGGTIWFLASVNQEDLRKPEPPPFAPTKPATPDNFEP